MGKHTPDKKMSKYGSKGYQALLKRLGSPEAVTTHFKKLGRRRWKLHPEQRAKKA